MSYQSDFRPELNTQPYRFIREIFTDEQTDAKIRRHLSDEHDVITENDLQNIVTVMTPDSGPTDILAAQKEGYS